MENDYKEFIEGSFERLDIKEAPNPRTASPSEIEDFEEKIISLERIINKQSEDNPIDILKFINMNFECVILNQNPEELQISHLFNLFSFFFKPDNEEISHISLISLSKLATYSDLSLLIPHSSIIEKIDIVIHSYINSSDVFNAKVFIVNGLRKDPINLLPLHPLVFHRLKDSDFSVACIFLCNVMDQINENHPEAELFITYCTNVINKLLDQNESKYNISEIRLASILLCKCVKMEIPAIIESCLMNSWYTKIADARIYKSGSNYTKEIAYDTLSILIKYKAIPIQEISNGLISLESIGKDLWKPECTIKPTILRYIFFLIDSCPNVVNRFISTKIMEWQSVLDIIFNLISNNEYKTKLYAIKVACQMIEQGSSEQLKQISFKDTIEGFLPALEYADSDSLKRQMVFCVKRLLQVHKQYMSQDDIDEAFLSVEGDRILEELKESGNEDIQEEALMLLELVFGASN